jgi:hypothetical protein
VAGGDAETEATSGRPRGGVPVARRQHTGMAARRAMSSLATTPPIASHSALNVVQDMRKARRNSIDIRA